MSSPQCQPAAIAHLCNACSVSILFHDESNAGLAFGAVAEGVERLLAIALPWQAKKIPLTTLIRSADPAGNVQLLSGLEAQDPAFIFHTSGTSTGLPKPIVQSHHAAFRVLPALDGRQSASFTTTPLYHGGIADCLRAWTSRALIWLFPAANVPITTDNIRFSISAAASATLTASAPQVKYFSSVPYVLQMLADDAAGLKILQSMEIVGVGGAALSSKTGDDLVQQGVNLVSRFGSAECGFLLSSRRDYSTDKEWQYLRLFPQSNYLSFEDQNDGSGFYELIVKRAWPHIAKSNREDGSFATSDLFEPHPTIRSAWKYTSRSDSQIILTTGKKFDPAPLEDLIASTSPLIREVMVFGSNRQSAGVLVFPSQDSLSVKDSVVEEEIWNSIQDINSKGQDHTRIYRDKIVIMSANQPLLERSSKGTLLRGAVEKKFAEDIDWAYSRNVILPEDEHVEVVVEDEDVEDVIRDIVDRVLGVDGALDDEADFYAHGVDSTTSSRIRSLIQKVSGFLFTSFVLILNEL